MTSRPCSGSTIGFDRLFDLSGAPRKLIPLQHRAAGRRPLPELSGDRGFLSGRGFHHGRAERRDHRRQQGRKGRARVPVQGHFDPAVQTAIQPGGLCEGEGRVFRNRGQNQCQRLTWLSCRDPESSMCGLVRRYFDQRKFCAEGLSHVSLPHSRHHAPPWFSERLLPRLKIGAGHRLERPEPRERAKNGGPRNPPGGGQLP
jgi:hypothetical protein